MSVISEVKKWLKDLRKKSTKAYVSLWVDSSSESNTPQIATSWSSGNFAVDSAIDMVAKEDKRIERKPVEVMSEILVKTPVISLADLDKQIKVVERRINVFKEQGCGCTDELLALKYLKARKKFMKNYKKFSWPVTTDAKIQELCSTYKLRLVGFQSYAKNVPMEAVDEVEKFVDAFTVVATPNDKPLLQLIIDDGGKETKKDPILLASSPFGKWHYVLGGWDKEVEYIDDLIYKGK